MQYFLGLSAILIAAALLLLLCTAWLVAIGGSASVVLSKGMIVLAIIGGLVLASRILN
ncbi:MAG: hypothetical protein HRU21_04425 [Pseudomonadales bacterium]|nr:hypothetical protein [Pseudomonadales bacterium]